MNQNEQHPEGLADLEAEKTRLEIEVLRKSLRPSYRNAAIMLGYLTTIATIITLTIQWRDVAGVARTTKDELSTAESALSERDRMITDLSTALIKGDIPPSELLDDARAAIRKVYYDKKRTYLELRARPPGSPREQYYSGLHGTMEQLEREIYALEEEFPWLKWQVPEPEGN